MSHRRQKKPSQILRSRLVVIAITLSHLLALPTSLALSVGYIQQLHVVEQSRLHRRLLADGESNTPSAVPSVTPGQTQADDAGEDDGIVDGEAGDAEFGNDVDAMESPTPTPAPESTNDSGSKTQTTPASNATSESTMKPPGHVEGNGTTTLRTNETSAPTQTSLSSPSHSPISSKGQAVDPSDDPSKVSAPPKASPKSGAGGQESASAESSHTGPPKLQTEALNWEGLGDPMAHLHFTLVVRNVGGGLLECRVVVPTFMKATPETVSVEGGESKNVSVAVLDPKGMHADSELLELYSNGGYHQLLITKEMLGMQTDWLGLPSLTSSALWLIGATVLGLGGLGACLWAQKRSRGAAPSFRYHELEMQAADGIDISTTLGQAPLDRRDSQGNGTSAKFSLDDDTGQNGWDDNWDDQWDDEERDANGRHR